MVPAAVTSSQAPAATLTAAAGTAKGRACSAGYPRATAPRTPAAVVAIQASSRAPPGPASDLPPDRWRQVRMAAVRPAATSSQVSGASPSEAATDPRPVGRPSSHPACPAPRSCPATHTGRSNHMAIARPSAAMSFQASWYRPWSSSATTGTATIASASGLTSRARPPLAATSGSQRSVGRTGTPQARATVPTASRTARMVPVAVRPLCTSSGSRATSTPASAAAPSRHPRCGGAGPGPAAAPEPGPTRISSRKSTTVRPTTPPSRNRLGTLASRTSPSSELAASVARSQAPTPSACNGSIGPTRGSWVTSSPSLPPAARTVATSPARVSAPPPPTHPAAATPSTATNSATTAGRTTPAARPST